MQLFSTADFDDIRIFSMAAGTVCAFTRRAPDKSTDNEDSLALLECDKTTAVLAVADGMGGLPAGDRASAITISELEKSVRAVSKDTSRLRGAILDGIEQANCSVLENTAGSGSTVAVVELEGRSARTYHVGDSSVLIVGQRGRIKHLTIPHSPVGYGVEAGIIEAREAMFHEDRHLISNMIGSEDMRVEIGPVIELAPRDTLLIGSDGLFDNMQTDEIIEIIRCGPLPGAAKELVRITSQRMQHAQPDMPHKPDDIGMILYRPGSR